MKNFTLIRKRNTSEFTISIRRRYLTWRINWIIEENHNKVENVKQFYNGKVFSQHTRWQFNILNSVEMCKTKRPIRIAKKEWNEIKSLSIHEWCGRNEMYLIMVVTIDVSSRIRTRMQANQSRVDKNKRLDAKLSKYERYNLLVYEIIAVTKIPDHRS